MLTFLFTDLVGSTEILARLGDSEAEAIRRTYFDLLRAPVASSGGREIKSLGDGLMAAFESPSDAVACAVGMQRAFDRHNRRGGERLDVRIGIQAGEAVEIDEHANQEDYFGRAVVEARRLCDMAQGGQILVSSLVHALAGPRSPYSFLPVGPLDLRGGHELIHSLEVIADRASAERLPLPPQLASQPAGTSAFVGRHAERDRLRASWRQTAGGERQLAFVAGEPGIGKTRLAAEFALEAYEEGADVLWGRSFEEALVPYQPFVQGLRHYVAHCDADELRRQLGRNAAPLVRLVPEVEARLPGGISAVREEPENERYLLFEAIAALVVEIAATTPLVLVFDDLQWADLGTLLLLKSIAIDPRPASLFVLGTYRDSEVSRSHHLAQTQADIARDRAFDLIELSGLVDDDVATLVEGLIGWAPPDEVVNSLQNETDGNPFFVEEVVRHLQDLGVTADAERLREVRTTVEELGVPKRVRELVGRRLQRLSPSALEALSVASIVGTEFRLDVLAAVLGASEEQLVEVMDETIDARLIVEVPGRIGGYGFSHALIQQGLYEEHTANRRASLHARIAEAYEELHPDAVVALAHHFSLAGERATKKVLEYGRAAGERALELLAFEQAVREFSQALEALAAVARDDLGTRADLLVLLGTAQTRAGDAPGAQASFEEAAEIARKDGNRATLARAALGYGGGAGFGGVWVKFATVDHTLVGFLEDALAGCPTNEDPTRIRLLARLAKALYWSREDRERRLALTQEALQGARRLGDPVALAHALDSRHVSLWGPDHLEELRGIAEEMLRVGEALDDRDIKLEALAWLITDALETDPIETVDVYIEAHAQIAAELRQPYHLWYTEVTRAMRAHLAGQFEEARRLAEVAWGHGAQAHGENARQAYLVQQLLIRLDEGTLDEMIDGLEAHVAGSPLPAWRAALGLAYMGVGRADDALAQVDHFADDGFTLIPRDCVWMTTVVSLARVVGRFDAKEYAQPLYELLLPFADRNCVVGGAVLCLGPISRLLGMLARVRGDYDQALRHLEPALERSRAIESPPLVTRTQFETAKVLLERAENGDEAEARLLLKDAAATASAFGLKQIAEHIAGLQTEMASRPTERLNIRRDERL